MLLGFVLLGLVLVVSFVVVPSTDTATKPTGSPAGSPVSTSESPLEAVARITRMEVISGPDEVKLADGATARTAVLRETRWNLKASPQSMGLSMKLEREAMQLSETERLEVMDRTDDHLQIWLVDLKDHPTADAAWVKAFTPEQRSNQYHRELVFLGRGKGHAWFGWMPIYQWTHLQSRLQLEGGDSPLAGAARGLAIEDPGTMTANSADAFLCEAGARALPYLKPLLDSPATLPRTLRVLARIPDPDAGAILLKYADSTERETAAQARDLIITFPRKDAEGAYFKWLGEDAGHVPLRGLLRACAEVNKPKLAPFLPRILESPKTPGEYIQAFELSRSLAGNAIPADLRSAEETIRKHGYESGGNADPQKVDAAVAELLASADTDAVACIGISLAVATTKGNWGAANQAGLKVLDSLPGGRGRLLAKRLADSSEDSWVREQLAPVLPR